MKETFLKQTKFKDIPSIGRTSLAAINKTQRILMSTILLKDGHWTTWSSLKIYCDSMNGGIMNENYSPVERRSKGCKERGSKGSNNPSKSSQANRLSGAESADGGPRVGKVCKTFS